MTDNQAGDQANEHRTSLNDYVLEELVALVNAGNYEISVTLQVSGMLVSGLLVSGKRFFEGYSDDLSSPFEPGSEMEEAVREFALTNRAVYDREGEEVDPPMFIHLRDARYVTPGGLLPTNNGVWWRGRLSEVGGFSLGSLSPAS